MKKPRGSRRGRCRRLSLCALLLGHSWLIRARFVVSERWPVLSGLLKRALRELRGVPREPLVDNMQQVVRLARSGDLSAVIQEEFDDFADFADYRDLEVEGFRRVASVRHHPGTSASGIRIAKQAAATGGTPCSP